MCTKYDFFVLLFCRIMPIIKSEVIPYLNEEILEQYTNVVVVSLEGLIIKMNPLLLCAMSPSLRKAMNQNDDDLTIITEFTLEELKQVKDFSMTGTCENSVGQSILHAFGLRNAKQVMVKNEVIEVKIEPVDYNNGEDDDDWDYEKETKADIKPKRNRKVPKASKRKKVAKVIPDDEDYDDNYDLDYVNDEDEEEIEDETWKSEEIVGKKRKSHVSIEKREDFKTFELPKTLDEYTKPPNKIREDMWTKCKKKAENMLDKNVQKCPQCDLTFQKAPILRLHVIKYHNDHLQCDLCDTATKVEDADEFKRHMFRHIVLGRGGLKECIQCEFFIITKINFF